MCCIYLVINRTVFACIAKSLEKGRFFDISDGEINFLVNMCGGQN